MTLSWVSYAQDQELFYFDFVEARLDESEINKDEIRKHYLGETIARKMLLVNESYVFVEPTSPTNPLPTRVVDKYPVYNSVKKLNSYYKKAIKQKTYTKEEALERFTKIMDVALCIRYQNTDDFEKVLLATKDAPSLDKLYASKVVLKGVYGALTDD